jgi:hypothetical protein
LVPPTTGSDVADGDEGLGPNPGPLWKGVPHWDVCPWSLRKDPPGFAPFAELVAARDRWDGHRTSGRSGYGTQPGKAAACFTQVASCASSRSSSWMSIQRASLLLPPGGTGRSDVPRKKVTLT